MNEFHTNAAGDNARRADGLVEVLTADKTLTSEDNGKTFLVATDALVVTLPPTFMGGQFTFINSGADGNNIVTISPDADDAIFGSIANAAADSVASGVDNKDLSNTKATANKGDRVKLVADGSTGWFIAEGVGIWASEA